MKKYNQTLKKLHSHSRLIMLGIFLSSFIYVTSFAADTTSRIPKELDLKNAVDYALMHNTDIQTQEQNIKIAKALYVQTRADWLLQVKLTSEMDKLEKSNANISNGISGTQSYTMIDVNQPVLTFGKFQNSIQGAKYYFENQAVQLRDVKENISYNVTLAYNNVILYKELVRVNEESVKNAEDHLKRAQIRFDQGVNTQYDVTRSKVDLANRKADLISYQKNLKIAYQSFNQLLNLSPNLEINLTGKLEYQNYDPNPEKSWELAQGNRPVLLSKNLDIKQYEKYVGYRKSGYYPTVSVGGNYSWYHVNYDNYNSKNFEPLFAYVKLSMPIFDSFKISGQVKEARGYLEQSRLAYQKELLNAQSEVEQTIFEINKQKELVAANKETIDLAETALQMARVSYENGRATSLDVADAELSLRSARINWLKAVNDYMGAIAKLKRVTGTTQLPG